MSDAFTGLATPRSDRAAVVPQPRRRWLTRWLIPLLLLGAAAGLLAYAARDALARPIPVSVQTVVVLDQHAPGADGAASRVAGPAVLAPGWIEPDPFAITVPALADGIIREVLVLEGEPVEAGQIVARLIDEDARLGEQTAAAMLQAREAEVQAATAMIDAERARAEELTEELRRKRELRQHQAITGLELLQTEFQLKAQEATVRMAEARAIQTGAVRDEAAAALQTARLQLSRMEIHSPSSGMVLTRHAQPGSLMKASGDSPESMTVLKLYDPAKLQVRVDVPLADAAKVGLDAMAEITTEALPSRVFHGRVSRLIHEANIQKNTVQVKVVVLDPSSVLRPEMLVRVKLLGAPADASQASLPLQGSGSTLMAPLAALTDKSDVQAAVWVIDESSQTAVHRRVAIGALERDGWIEVTDGLRAGDRVILNPPPQIHDGSRVNPEASQ